LKVDPKPKKKNKNILNNDNPQRINSNSLGKIIGGSCNLNRFGAFEIQVAFKDPKVNIELYCMYIQFISTYQ
jgi:hypothetical protein